MAKKKAAQKEYMYCPVCGDLVLKTDNADQNREKMVKHFEVKHPDRMAKCFDEAGRTWNAQYDSALQGLHNYKKQLDEVTEKYKQELAMRNSLAARLNAIIMILERKD